MTVGAMIPMVPDVLSYRHEWHPTEHGAETLDNPTESINPAGLMNAVGFTNPIGLINPVGSDRIN